MFWNLPIACPKTIFRKNNQAVEIRMIEELHQVFPAEFVTRRFLTSDCFSFIDPSTQIHSQDTSQLLLVIRNLDNSSQFEVLKFLPNSNNFSEVCIANQTFTINATKMIVSQDQISKIRPILLNYNSKSQKLRIVFNYWTFNTYSQNLITQFS